MENSSRLRKVLKKGTAIRVLRQGTAADGGKRALVTHDPPIEDHKGRVEGWVMWSDKGEDFIKLLESDAMVPGGDGKAVADIVQSVMPRSNLRRGAATGVDMFDGFDDSFDTDKIAGTARPDMDSREAKLAARFARGAHTTASAAIVKAAEATQASTSTLNEGPKLTVKEKHKATLEATINAVKATKAFADAPTRSQPRGHRVRI